jgi:hypothetical protein
MNVSISVMPTPASRGLLHVALDCLSNRSPDSASPEPAGSVDRAVSAAHQLNARMNPMDHFEGRP